MPFGFSIEPFLATAHHTYSHAEMYTEIIRVSPAWLPVSYMIGPQSAVAHSLPRGYVESSPLYSTLSFGAQPKTYVRAFSLPKNLRPFAWPKSLALA